MQLELQGLVDGGDEPWGWLAKGHWDDKTFLKAIDLIEEREWGEKSDREPVERGWGRWVRPDNWNNPWDKTFKADGWPIPFLNFKYTLVILK